MASTEDLELELVRGVLKRAKRWNLLAEEIKFLPTNEKVGRALEVDEKLRLLKVAASRPEWQVAKCATILALNTTMRKVEIRGLRWCDVDLIGGSLTVRRKTTKTDAGERVIPLNEDALAAILEMRERGKAFLGDDVSSDWYVFFRHEAYNCSPAPDRPMGYTAWRRAFRRNREGSEVTGPPLSRFETPCDHRIGRRASQRHDDHEHCRPCVEEDA